MQPRVGRQPGDLRVDHDDFHTALHEIDNPVTAETIGVGAQRVVSPDEHGLGDLVLGVVVAVGELLRAVGNPEGAGGRSHAGDAGQIACAAREEPKRASAREKKDGHLG